MTFWEMECTLYHPKFNRGEIAPISKNVPKSDFISIGRRAAPTSSAPSDMSLTHGVDRIEGGEQRAARVHADGGRRRRHAT